MSVVVLIERRTLPDVARLESISAAAAGRVGRVTWGPIRSAPLIRIARVDVAGLDLFHRSARPAVIRRMHLNLKNVVTAVHFFFLFKVSIDNNPPVPRWKLIIMPPVRICIGKYLPARGVITIRRP